MMNCFSLLPPGNPAVQLLPTLLSSILEVTFPEGECLSPRAKANCVCVRIGVNEHV